MSFFPTRILVATEGSEEAELAATAAAELAKSTDSELHIVHVSEPGAEVSLNPAYSINRDLLEGPLRELERQGRHLLNGQVKKIEEAGEPSRKPISGSEADQTTRSLSWPRS